MADKTVTVTLPEALYERVVETAKASAMTQEEVLAQSIALALPVLEADLPDELRSALSTLSVVSDQELWRFANHTMDDERQEQLEALAELQKVRTLNTIEQAMLEQLMKEAEFVMLRKAEALRLLARRGYKVFSSSDK